MGISKEQRAALEAKGYTIGRSGNTVLNSKGQTVGGFNENNQVFSGNATVRDILKSKPTPAAPKPAAKPAAPARRAEAPKPAPKPKPQPRRPVTPTPAPKPKAADVYPRPGVNRSGAPGAITRRPSTPTPAPRAESNEDRRKKTAAIYGTLAATSAAGAAGSGTAAALLARKRALRRAAAQPAKAASAKPSKLGIISRVLSRAGGTAPHGVGFGGSARPEFDLDRARDPLDLMRKGGRVKPKGKK